MTARTESAEALPQTATEPAAVPSTSAPKIEFIQILRGLSVLLVVWGHLAAAWLDAHGRTWRPLTWYREAFVGPFHLFQDGAHLGVLVFFLISGYIITHTSLRESHTQFAVKRVFRIFPLLFAALAVAMGLQVMAKTIHIEGLWGVSAPAAREFIESFLLVNWATGDHRMLGPTWTLEIEILFYLLTFLVLSRSRRSSLAATWVMAGIWAAFNVAIFVIVPGQAGAVHHPVYVGFLLLGRVIYLAQRKLIQPMDAALVFATILTVELAMHMAGFPGELLGGDAGSLFAQIGALLIFVAALRLNPQRAIQPFRFFGDISYSLYLLHIPVGMFVNNVGLRLGIPFSVSFVAAVGASVGAAALSYRFLEKPFQRLARRVLRTSPRVTGMDAAKDTVAAA